MYLLTVSASDSLEISRAVLTNFKLFFTQKLFLLIIKLSKALKCKSVKEAKKG